MCGKKLLCICLLPLPWVSVAQSNEGSDSVHRLSDVVVTARQMLGSKFEAANRTGSAYYISPVELQKLGYTDINRMLKAVPGVNVYEEDGFGLRPNISLRGTKAERSERVTIMEDGILAAPAPYAAPAAYYFPNAARMYAVEVVKGSSQVQYGPFTTGGAINMVSTPIPTRFSGKASVSYGRFNTLKFHAYVGNTYKHWGYLVEYLRYSSDGFRVNPIPQDDRKGFLRDDVIGKLRYQTAHEVGINQVVELKFGYAHEDSDETYLGLSEHDFVSTPYRRYVAAQMDRMKTQHQQWALTHILDAGNSLRLTSGLYLNRFHRNWYKVNEVRAGVTAGEKKGIAEVLADTETNHRYYEILTGQRDYLGEAIIDRSNERTYHSGGFQTRAEYKHRLGVGYLNVEGGLRLHHDDEDRYQWDDGYSIVGGRMELFLPGLHGSQSNKITSAEALASYILGKYTTARWTLTAGIRYEDVYLRKKDYTAGDLRRSGHLRIEETNHVRSLIPGMGVSYKATRELSLFGGVHKGFAPPTAERGQEPEKSLNMEAGVRYQGRGLRAEVIGFFNDYRNMLGSDLAAAGGQGTLDQFDVGQARIWGLECLVHYQPLPEEWRVKLPIQLSYTYTGTEMRNSFFSSSWGRVFYGDELPYITKHAFNAQIGVEHKYFDITCGLHYNGAMRSTPGQGVIASSQKIPAHTILDASVHVKLWRQLSLDLNAINLTGQKYIVSRHPSGVRPGHPFGISAGLKVRL